MILEVAILIIKEGEETNFEKDFALAGQYISAIKGYKGHSLKKCIEQDHKYILLVNWDNLESHEVGFRQSREYLKWKELLHKYYDPFPVVEHYETIIEKTTKSTSDLS